MDLVHKFVYCECGWCGEIQLMDLHRKYQCSHHLQWQCPFCEITLAYINRGEHMYKCGSRTVECDHCLMRLLVRDLKRHMEEKHNNITN